jgi:site-specific DNA-methyltransferase (adenine-specific)
VQTQGKTMIYNDDCLKILPTLPDNSIDLVLTDPPYGTTACKWDSIIPFEPMWKELKRISKENTAIVLFGNEPFSSHLRLSNLDCFKQDLIWLKTRPSNVFNAKKMFMNWHETISIFYNKLPTYNPQLEQGKPYKKTNYLQNRSTGIYGKTGEKENYQHDNKGTRYPKTVLEFSNPNNNSLHPTQKPIALLEYLIKTYTNEGDTVLDFTMGSGSTGVAAKNTNRKFIGIEMDKNYFDIAKNRIETTLL